MTTKKPAAAGQKTAAKSPASPNVVKGVKLQRLPMEANKPSHPVAFFKGAAPKAGSTIEFTLENNVTYRGVVADATAADGEVMVEFSAPLTAVPQE